VNVHSVVRSFLSNDGHCVGGDDFPVIFRSGIAQGFRRDATTVLQARPDNTHGVIGNAVTPHLLKHLPQDIKSLLLL